MRPSPRSYRLSCAARRGFSLIDVIVATALVLVLFLSLMGILKASIAVSTLARAKAGATTIAQAQMEYLRGLSYDALGVAGGIPPGAAAPESTTTENGITYTTRTRVFYVDSPADGLGAADQNGITTDYKEARVSVSYTMNAVARSVVLVSDFAPPGIETTNGGGTLKINVVNAVGAGVPGASVTIVNTAVSPPVNTALYANDSGIVYLPGAATSSQYQIAVTKNGYSSAQTYARDSTNANPDPGFLTVVKDQTTTGTFAIDLLGTLVLNTFSPIATSTFADAFADASKLASMSSTTAGGGSLDLVSGAVSGSARSIAIAPAYLSRWGEVSATTSVPAGASVAFHIYDGAGVLLPDTVLPGNSAGFSSTPLDLFAVATTTYPSLSIGAELRAGANPPSITGWSFSYAKGPVPLPNVPITLTGAKTIGSTSSGVPIYKTTANATTDGSGTRSLALEWDSYQAAITGYDIVDACPEPPFAVPPGGTLVASLFLRAPTANTLRVLVVDAAGAPVSGASVTLSRTGFSQEVPSASCGNAYFSGLSSGTYTVTVDRSGFPSAVFPGISVSGSTRYVANLP